MGYKSWFETLARKHRAIVQAHSDLSDEVLVDYFAYEHMATHESDYCPLYATRTKCHEMEELNCYLCGCPEFRFCDRGFAVREGKRLFSYCAVHSRFAAWIDTPEGYHLDCSGCSVPHRKRYILRHFDRDWRVIMRRVPCEEEVSLPQEEAAELWKEIDQKGAS